VEYTTGGVNLSLNHELVAYVAIPRRGPRTARVIKAGDARELHIMSGGIGRAFRAGQPRRRVGGRRGWRVGDGVTTDDKLTSRRGTTLAVRHGVLYHSVQTFR